MRRHRARRDGHRSAQPILRVERTRPLWLLPHPQPLPNAPAGIGEPERIESGWWDGADVRRDYYTIEWHDARAWVFREHTSGRWYLHGWWA